MFCLLWPSAGCFRQRSDPRSRVYRWRQFGSRKKGSSRSGPTAALRSDACCVSPSLATEASPAEHFLVDTLGTSRFYHPLRVFRLSV